MAPVPSASGERVNWINYKTGHKAVKFTMAISKGEAIIAIVVTDSLAFQTITQWRSIFSLHAGTGWQWSHGRVQQSLSNVHLQQRDEWPALIKFFKEGLLQLDQFWEEIKYVL